MNHIQCQAESFCCINRLKKAELGPAFLESAERLDDWSSRLFPQDFGFGGPEELRIQGANLEMTGNVVRVGKHGGPTGVATICP